MTYYSVRTARARARCRHHRGAAAPWVPWARAAQGGSSPAADNESTMHILMMLAVCLRLGEVSAAPVSPPDHEAANGLAAFEFHHTSTHRSGLTGPALRRHATQPQLAPQLLAPLFVLRRTVVGRKRVHRVRKHPGARWSVRSCSALRTAVPCRPRIARPGRGAWVGAGRPVRVAACPYRSRPATLEAGRTRLTHRQQDELRRARLGSSRLACCTHACGNAAAQLDSGRLTSPCFTRTAALMYQ